MLHCLLVIYFVYDVELLPVNCYAFLFHFILIN